MRSAACSRSSRGRCSCSSACEPGPYSNTLPPAKSTPIAAIQRPTKRHVGPGIFPIRGSPGMACILRMSSEVPPCQLSKRSDPSANRKPLNNRSAACPIGLCRAANNPVTNGMAAQAGRSARDATVVAWTPFAHSRWLDGCGPSTRAVVSPTATPPASPLSKHRTEFVR
jgi:hypothetical protein